MNIASIAGVDTGTVTIIMIFAIPLVAIIGGLAVEALKVVRQGDGRAGRQASAEETRLVQQMHEMLQKMEERIEALETLLIDREQKREEVQR